MYSSICKVIGWIILVFGFIGSIYYAVKNGPNLTLTLVYFIAGAFGTLVESIIFLSISKILETVKGLENSISEIKDHLYSNSKFDRVPTENEWKCQGCGRINSIHTGTCACGNEK